MRRGPAIGGHLPRVSKTVLEQMTSAEKWAYHSMRRDVFAARADFFMRLALWSAAVALIALVVGLILQLT